MGQRIVQVDAFADAPYRGNPAAVCVLPGARSEGWMAAVAREMNLSETAFLVRRDDGWGLRWFTPTVEIALCGHATLASAHVLWEDGESADEVLRFHTMSGVLAARREGDTIVLDFPAEMPADVDPPAGLLGALGIKTPSAVARNRLDLLVEVNTAAEVRSLKPDYGRLRGVEARGVIVTARSDDGEHDFISRFFAPAAGVDEDPVTGSAHCALAPWWARRLGRMELRGYQASERGGSVGVRLRGDRVELVGRAITVLRGELVGAAATDGDKR